MFSEDPVDSLEVDSNGYVDQELPEKSRSFFSSAYNICIVFFIAGVTFGAFIMHYYVLTQNASVNSVQRLRRPEL